MSIPGVCPDCGCKAPLQQFLQDANARKALLGALKVSPMLADRVVAYLGMFSPGDRAIRMDYLARILDELAEPIASAELEYNRVTYAAPVSYWAQALDQMLANRNNIDLPLKGHGYLFKVVASISAKAAGAQEQKKEAALRQGVHRQAPTSAASDVMQKAAKKIAKKRSAPPEWTDNQFVKNATRRRSNDSGE